MCGILGIVVVKPSDSIKNYLYKIYKSQKHRGNHGCGMVKLSYRATMTRRRGVDSDELFTDTFESFYANLQRRDRLLLHHRFASHGGSGDVIESNHPFIDEAFNTALMHNGVIYNHAELYKTLKANHHSFESELRLITKRNEVIQQNITDSEVILHLIDKNPIQQAGELAKLEGSCAIAVVNKNTKGILLYKWHNPIIVSKDEWGNFYFSSEFNKDSGLTFIANLDEGVLYRLSVDGLEKLKVIRSKPVETPKPKSKNQDLGRYYGGLYLDKASGIWVKPKDDPEESDSEDEKYSRW